MKKQPLNNAVAWLRGNIAGHFSEVTVRHGVIARLS